MIPLLMIGIIGVRLFQNARRWNHDNHSPRLTVLAKVVCKRDDRRHHRKGNHMHHRTYYYATFQFESGDRLELELQGHEYGLLVEGDQGKLTFQGTRYLGFERT
jgi:hypothetical protein